MTCGEQCACNLCDSYKVKYYHPADPPPPPRPVAAYLGTGNLTYEVAHPGKVSHTPLVQLCSGCLNRVTARGPLRIQRRRIRGWRMPPNTVVVDRSTKYGNRYGWSKWELGSQAQAVSRYKEALERALDDTVTPALLWAWNTAAVNELRGKNLACWCRLCSVHRDGRPLTVTCQDCDPCHVDILGPAANS